ncbi:NAD(P)H-hydrate dehydratase [Heliorestis convoluta]|uniref:Bifunctional NAD(P)H-hydrate repair enzyme n=1 Tax=Heliorestis convoluta TaxID=356322 RepID=A0A5Q2N6V3_9FIRM|nr:NAD(P)H-hydrate dehydratase [Heliorestis convoluta]QGG49112.1 bifunctional ADP-dependent NAD(P)H-hydrate dehydratase/NAD(P)H-hydrate epimerase [Heliorestis convoluta]
MRVVTAAEMNRMDQRATEEYGIPSLLLMENAGIEVAKQVTKLLGGTCEGKSILILCGKGSNGGDGFVVARHLLNKGADVKLFLLAPERDVRGDALTNLTIYKRMGGKIYALMDQKDLNALRMGLLSTHLVVDAIYGTGFSGTVPKLITRAIEMLNELALPTLAVDVPSGLEVNTGKISNICLKATMTVTFGLPKLGLLLEPGASVAGKLVVVDISIPRDLLDNPLLTRRLLTSKVCKSWLRQRDPEAHKGNFGHLLIMGGSNGMAGAITLTVQGALRSGTGKTTVAVPEGIASYVIPQVSEAMSLSLSAPQGRLEASALEGKSFDSFTSFVVGPGLGRYGEAALFLQEFLEKTKGPVVIDADALMALEGNIESLAAAQGPLVLTPHPGEMARLTGLTIEEIQQNRLQVVTHFAKDWGVTIALKGARTLIATAEGELFINPTGNPGMATAGSGDVLAGVLGSLLAQGYSPAQGAALAVYVHGLAGDIAVELYGHKAMKAGDIVASLPAAWKRIEED